LRHAARNRPRLAGAAPEAQAVRAFRRRDCRGDRPARFGVLRASTPSSPPEKTALVLNFDCLPPVSAAQRMWWSSGAERTTFWPLVQEVALHFNLAIQPDPRPEQGSYFTGPIISSFARAGIPRLFPSRRATSFQGKPEGYGDQVFREYNTQHYHQPIR